MDKFEFDNKVKEIMGKTPKLFALDQDGKANMEMIEQVEKNYNLILPSVYKDFVNQYGGGYFGFIVVYSCDCNGMFYINDNVSKEWVLEKSFLPVVDFETGDFLGFEIEDGICRNEATIYLHEEDEIHGPEMDFYNALLKYGLKCME